MKKFTISLFSMLCFTGYGFSQNWLLHMQRPDLEMNDIGFINASQGYIIGDSSSNGTFVTGAFIRTTDGGQSWTNHTFGNSAYTINKAFFINTQEGFAVGRNGGGNNGLFIKTTNGGDTWTGASAFNERAFNVCFTSAQQGWVMGKNGLLSRTTDGGTSWTTQSVTNEDIFAMQFFNSSKGIFSCSGGELYQTTDGGVSWNAVASGTGEDLMALTIRGSRAWVAGQNGTLLYSNDNGDTWISQAPSSNNDLTAVSFADQDHGWSAGVGGVLDFTVDGGNTWQAGSSNTTEDISAISVPDVNHGWFCTMAGEVYSFSNTSGIPTGAVMNDEIKYYPNPVSDYLNISFTLKKDHELTLFIQDMQGRTVLDPVPLTNYYGEYKGSFLTMQLEAGSYIGYVNGMNFRKTFRFIKTE